jgi:hypothetical protein
MKILVYRLIFSINKFVFTEGQRKEYCDLREDTLKFSFAKDKTLGRNSLVNA